MRVAAPPGFAYRNPGGKSYCLCVSEVFEKDIWLMTTPKKKTFKYERREKAVPELEVISSQLYGYSFNHQ